MILLRSLTCMYRERRRREVGEEEIEEYCSPATE
jgi:hypothetical protein